MIVRGPHLASFCAATLLAATPGWASAAEQIDQLEPGGGEWQAEYFGSYGGGDAHVVEAMYGISDRIALGGEIEIEHEDGAWEEGYALALLGRFNDPEEAVVGLGLKAEVGLGSDGDLAEIEARLIAERKRARWWSQLNLMLRHAREDGGKGTGIAYAANVSHAPVDGLWLGVEASGRLARLSGEAELAPRGEHYVGPAAMAELELGEDSGVEIGAGWLWRIDGDGPASAPRLFVQFEF